jgi:hypothetical protein
MWDEPSTRREPLHGLSGPVTAREAFREIWPEALARDPAPRLMLVTSGEDIGPDGRSGLWEFQLDLPTRVAHATYGIGFDDDPDAASGVLLLVEHLRPFVPPDDPWDLMRMGEEAARARRAEHWRRLLAGRTALPIAFYDSPQAAAALTAQGVRWEPGRGLYLAGKSLVSGDAVWSVQVGSEAITTPWAPPALPPPGRDLLPPPA